MRPTRRAPSDPAGAARRSRRAQRRGRRRPRNPGQGARLLRRLRLCQRRDSRVPDQLRRAPSSSPPPRLRRCSPRRWPHCGCWNPNRRLVDRLQKNAATLRGALLAEGLGGGRGKTQIIPVQVGDAERTMALSERILERRRLRPGDPPPDRARGLLAAALHGDGDPPRRAAGSRRQGRSAGGAGARHPPHPETAARARPGRLIRTCAGYS